jgi:hypothetical protein
LEGLLDLLLVIAHDALIVDGERGKGATGVQFFNFFGGFDFFFTLEEIDLDKMIFHPPFIQELLRFSAPNAGAQGIEDNPPLILSGDMSHSHLPLPPPFGFSKKFNR